MKKELRIPIIFLSLFFALFLVLPVTNAILGSFVKDGSQGFTFVNFQEILKTPHFIQIFLNSIFISAFSSIIAVTIAFLLSYALNYTNINRSIKSVTEKVLILPMLLPTITYGFAMIYAFGKKGMITQLFGKQLFHLYGFNGLVLGYVIYTLPISFLMIHNTMRYIDKQYGVVSRLMMDSPLKTFQMTVLRPLTYTLFAAFIQSFFMCFTDYGIPSYIGGTYKVIATVLYNEMLGSLPNFGHGAVIALFMLMPSVFGMICLTIMEKHNIRYDKITEIVPVKNKIRDGAFLAIIIATIVVILSVFITIFIVPFVEEWPYNLTFSVKNVVSIIKDPSISTIYLHSVFVALLTAFVGTLSAYMAGILVCRTNLKPSIKKSLDTLSIVTNTVPGMVLGIAYLLIFRQTPLKNTFFLIICCNILHYFTTPYLMLKDSLLKMNDSWEKTARLMGDTFFQTLRRVITPNLMPTIIEVFSYYFVNAMVTVSAVIFITGTKTMLVTTKIKELQYFNKYNEIFVLSILLFLTNLFSKIMFHYLSQNRKRKGGKKGDQKTIANRSTVSHSMY